MWTCLTLSNWMVSAEPSVCGVRCNETGFTHLALGLAGGCRPFPHGTAGECVRSWDSTINVWASLKMNPLWSLTSKLWPLHTSRNSASPQISGGSEIILKLSIGFWTKGQLRFWPNVMYSVCEWGGSGERSRFLIFCVKKTTTLLDVSCKHMYE